MGNKSEISERISEIIEYLGVNPNVFSKKLGYDRSQTVYDVINGKSAPSYDFFHRLVISEYSEILNLDWLFSGHGEMLKNSYKEMDTAHEKNFEYNNKCVQCKEKDRIIDILSDRVEELKDTISILKETTGYNPKQKYG